jgi:hypothetical protein
MNTKLRAKANNEMEKDMYKLMNNAIFGKTMENVRKRSKIDLHQNPLEENYESKEGYEVAVNQFKKRMHKLEMSPLVESFKVIREDKLLAVENTRNSVLLNKPVVCGFSILELSKLEMYNFHYNKFKKHYGDNLKMLMTDTDSFIYEIKTKDLYSDLEKFKNDFDFSNLPKKHPLFNNDNKKVVGKMKIETGALQILEFVGIRSKCYSYIVNENEQIVNKKICKGVKKAAVDRKINHQNYYDAIFNCKRTNVSFNNIKSKNHNITSSVFNKAAIVPFDDKRLLRKDGINTYAIGHKNTKNNNDY